MGKTLGVFPRFRPLPNPVCSCHCMSRVHVVALGRGNIYANVLGRFNAVDTGRDFIAAVAGLICVMCDVWAATFGSTPSQLPGQRPVSPGCTCLCFLRE